jgi:hypothetical protein
MRVSRLCSNASIHGTSLLLGRCSPLPPTRTSPRAQHTRSLAAPQRRHWPRPSAFWRSGSGGDASVEPDPAGETGAAGVIWAAGARVRGQVVRAGHDPRAAGRMVRCHRPRLRLRHRSARPPARPPAHHCERTHAHTHLAGSNSPPAARSGLAASAFPLQGRRWERAGSRGPSACPAEVRGLARAQVGRRGSVFVFVCARAPECACLRVCVRVCGRQHWTAGRRRRGSGTSRGST